MSALSRHIDRIPDEKSLTRLVAIYVAYDMRNTPIERRSPGWALATLRRARASAAYVPWAVDK